MLRLLAQRSINRWREGWRTGYHQRVLYRFFGTTLALLTPLYGYILRQGSPEAYEPIITRWVFCGLFLLLVGLSYTPGFFKRHFVLLMHVAAGLLLGWIVHLSVINGLAPNYAITALVTAFTFILGTGVGSRSLVVPLSYVAIIFGTALGTWPYMDATHVDLLPLSLNMFSGILIALLITGWASQQDHALAESHQRYHMFIQNSTEGIWRLEFRKPISTAWPVERQIEAFFEHAYVAEANPAQATMYGVKSPEVFFGLPIDGMLPADDVENRALFHRIIANGYQMKDAETKEQTLDGEERWFLNNITAEIKDGHVLRMWGVQRDITARKAAERERALSEQKLALHAERSPMGFIEWNLQNEVVGWNKAAEHIFGFTATEIVGHAPRDQMVPPELHARIRSILERVVEQKETAHGTNTNLTKDGREITCEWFNTPLIDAEGRVIGVASLVHDVTERERITAALRHSEKRYSTLFHGARAAIVIHDLEGHILDVNQSTVDLFGYDADVLKTMRVSELHPAALRDRCFEKIEALTPKESLQVELDGQRKDGSVFASEITIQRVQIDDMPVVQALIRDITEKRLWTERTLHAQRLESLGTLASGIAHDLNNALNPVLMGLDLIRKQHGLSAPSLDILEQIESSAIRGAHLIKQVLAFSQGIEGRKAAIHPADHIHELAHLIRQTFPADITLKLDLSSPLAPIYADASQFQQVLMNMCNNARDAMPEGGTLTLHASVTRLQEVDVRLYPDLEAGTYLKVDIADTGIGMSSETKKKLFEPFYTTKPLEEGPGLGLSVALGIVRSHRGAVHVYSELGVGTRLSVFWPTHTSATEAIAAAPLPSAASQTERTILVVDDEPALLEITQQALELEGYTIATATNGQEAWELFQETPDRFDLILTDMMMPDVDGSALIRQVRTVDSDIKIVAVSGLDVSPSTLDTLKTPYFLAKPYRMDQLLTLIQEVLA